MSFEIRQIEGAVVKKGKHEKLHFCDGNLCAGCQIQGENYGIDVQSRVRLQFNRKKLAQIIQSSNVNATFQIGLKIADSIIAKDKEIIEVVK